MKGSDEGGENEDMRLDCDEKEGWKPDSESDPDIAKEDGEELISDFWVMSVAPGEVDREEVVEDG